MQTFYVPFYMSKMWHDYSNAIVMQKTILHSTFALPIQHQHSWKDAPYMFKTRHDLQYANVMQITIFHSVSTLPIQGHLSSCTATFLRSKYEQDAAYDCDKNLQLPCE